MRLADFSRCHTREEREARRFAACHTKKNVKIVAGEGGQVEGGKQRKQKEAVTAGIEEKGGWRLRKRRTDGR